MSELSITDNNYLIVRCDYSEKNIVKQVGGIFDKRMKAWIMPLSMYSVNFLIDNLTNISLSSDFEEKIKAQIQKEERLEKIRKMAKADKPIKFKIPGIKDGVDLFNYQKLGVLFGLTNNSGILLADQPGLGKTIQAISMAVYKKYKEGIKNCLIITPASLKFNWPLEIKKFTDERCIVIDGTPQERVKQWLAEEVFFYITNFEMVIEDLFGGRNYEPKMDDDDSVIAKKTKQKERSAMRAAQLEEVREKIWGMICVDEVHALKNHESRRSKCCKALKSYFKLGLTGTPIDGRLEELHSIYEFIQPGLFENKTLFLQKHATFDWSGKIVSYKNISEVRERIKPFFLRRIKEEVLKDLPDKIYQNRYVIFTSEEEKVYKEIAERAHELTEEAEVMETILRCKQFCDHPNLIGVETKTCSKLESFKEILDELVVKNGAKVIVFSQYSKMCEILIKVLEEMGLKYFYIWAGTDKKERADMQSAFNTDPTIDVMIGTDAMSTGLNFTGASYVINYDDYWSPSIMEQRECRAYRIGQKSTVTVINFITKDTIEERVRDVLYNKAKVSSEVLGDMTDETILKRLGPQDIAKLL